MPRAKANRRISKSLGQMKSHYSVVVIGSGYGGSIAASRLARAGRSVCLLERGKEKQPGEYPDTIGEGAGEIQMDLPGHHVGSRTAMFDFRVNDDIHALIGCGLGGTSLINANVALRAEPRVLEDDVWPAPLRAEARAGGLDKFYDRAVEMLRPREYPVGQPGYAEPLKTTAQRASATCVGAPFKLTPINVNFEAFPEGRNHVGVEQQPCTNCGDCVSGCNYGAKNTVLMNYLPDAFNHGAEIFTQAAVKWIARQEASNRWSVFFEPAEMEREKFDSPPMFVTADVVMLAAGALGSTEIMLRSAAKGLPLSGRVGSRFTGNGDVLGFSYNCDVPINGIGRGSKEPDGDHPVGPCITSVIDAREQDVLNDGMVIEEGSVPGLVGPLLPAAMAAAAASVGKDTDGGFRDWLREFFRVIKSFFFGPSKGAVKNTQTMLVMTHDDSNGRMNLQDDRLRIDWQGVGDQPVFEKVNANLMKTTKPLGGTFVRNPIWTDLLKKNLITVHPLGGCPMAESAEGGVVNHQCQVFSGTMGDAVYDGLYVVDGAVMPRSLGVNPLLTISALAERACERLAEQRGWSIHWSAKRPDQPPGRKRTTGFRFTEKMTGHIASPLDGDAADDDLEKFRRAAKRAESDSSVFHFVLTIDGLDLDGFLKQPEHQAHMMGIVVAPMLSDQPLTATEGRFNLFTQDAAHEHTKEMRYAMNVTSTDGKSFFFEGFKRVRDDAGIDVWTDTSTLYVTIYDGRDATGNVLARGVLKIAIADFTQQMQTMLIPDADSTVDRAAALARFGRFFAGQLWDTYGAGQ